MEIHVQYTNGVLQATLDTIQAMAKAWKVY